MQNVNSTFFSLLCGEHFAAVSVSFLHHHGVSLVFLADAQGHLLQVGQQSLTNHQLHHLASGDLVLAIYVKGRKRINSILLQKM